MSDYKRLTLYTSDDLLTEFAEGNHGSLPVQIRYSNRNSGLLGKFVIRKRAGHFVLEVEHLNDTHRSEFIQLKHMSNNQIEFENLDELKSFITDAINIVRTESEGTTPGSSRSSSTARGKKSRRRSTRSRKTRKSRRHRKHRR